MKNESLVKKFLDGDYVEIPLKKVNSKVLNNIDECILMKRAVNNGEKINYFNFEEEEKLEVVQCTERFLYADSDKVNCIFSTYYSRGTQVFISLSPHPVEVHCFSNGGDLNWSSKSVIKIMKQINGSMFISSWEKKMNFLGHLQYDYTKKVIKNNGVVLHNGSAILLFKKQIFIFVITTCIFDIEKK